MSSSNLETYLKSFQRDDKLHAFQEPIRADLIGMQDLLRDFFHSRVGLVQEVGEHLLTMAGKRFRPALTLLIARMNGQTSRDPIFAAAVIELIHTATLVHDDTIDKSALRRGLPTINALYNDLVATILGDYIYTKVLVDLFDRGEDSVVRVITRTTFQMSIGEMLQIQQKRNARLREEEYLELVDAKTASLMSASCEVGALVAGFGPDEVETLRLFGMELGRAYQITDDIFDYVGDAGELGKYAHSDLAEGKVTLPLLHALREAGAADRERARRALGKKEPGNRDVAFLAGLVARHDGIGYAASRAREYVRRGKRYLAVLPDSPARSALVSLSDYVISRTN